MGLKENPSPRKRSRLEDLNENIEEIHEWLAHQGVDFATLVGEKLHSEQKRSDPEGRWQKKLQWLNDVKDHGGTLDEADRLR